MGGRRGPAGPGLRGGHPPGGGGARRRRARPGLRGGDLPGARGRPRRAGVRARRGRGPGRARPRSRARRRRSRRRPRVAAVGRRRLRPGHRVLLLLLRGRHGRRAAGGGPGRQARRARGHPGLGPAGALRPAPDARRPPGAARRGTGGADPREAGSPRGDRLAGRPGAPLRLRPLLRVRVPRRGDARPPAALAGAGPAGRRRGGGGAGPERDRRGPRALPPPRRLVPARERMALPDREAS